MAKDQERSAVKSDDCTMKGKYGSRYFFLTRLGLLMNPKWEKLDATKTGNDWKLRFA